MQELQGRLQDETWVPHSKTYQCLMGEVARVNETLAHRTREVEAMARERDEAIREVQVKSYHFSVRGRGSAGMFCYCNMSSQHKRRAVQAHLEPHKTGIDYQCSC